MPAPNTDVMAMPASTTVSRDVEAPSEMPKMTSAVASAPANAARLRSLAAWVAAESAAGKAPLFGNTDPGSETLAALAGSLETAGDIGTAVYCVTLRAEYTELYEGGQI